MESQVIDQTNCPCVCHEILKDLDEIHRPKPVCDDCGHGEYHEGYPYGKDPNFFDN